MKSGISFFLTLCLLTLLSLPSCSSRSDQKTLVSSSSIKEANADLIRQKIAESPKPYVLLNFYTSWCKPCKVELPGLVDLSKDPEKHVSVILVSLDEAQDVNNILPGFLGTFGVDFVSFYKSEEKEKFVSEFATSWDGEIPLNLLYTREGKLIETLGLTGPDEIEMMINLYEKTQKN